MSNAPTVLFGSNPVFRAVVRTSTTDTATTITADDGGTLFVNLNATGTHTYTLPAVADCNGKFFTFYTGQTSTGIAITGTTAVVMGVDNAAATTITGDAVVGSWCMIVGDGTYYYCLVGTGTWTVSA